MNANALLPIIGPDPHTPEWYEVHKTHITATDIAPILGRSDYKTALDVFAEKTGRIAPFGGNANTRRGQRYEPVILADYAEATGCIIENPLPLYFHPVLSFLAATPDARAKFGSVMMCGPGDCHGVEAKYSMSPARGAQLGEEGTDFVPDDWLLQCQTQMAVMGWPRGDLAVLLYGRLRIYPIAREPDLIQTIEAAAKEFYERIVNDDPPEPQWEHEHTPSLIKALYGLKQGTEVELSAESESHWRNYRELGELIKMHEAEMEVAKSRVLAYMKDAEIGLLPHLGIQLIRQEVRRKEYTVKATSYTTLRQRKLA